MKLSVVIPNYNGERFLVECLVALRNQTFDDFEILLVDNASEDNSINVSKMVIPNIRVIQLDKNEGFSKAVNQGIKVSQGEFVVLLNNDTVVFNDFLEELLKTMEGDIECFSCSSKMIKYSEKDKIDDIGDAYTLFGLAYQEGHGSSINNYINNKEIFSSCAGAAIYRKKVFEEIGFFDENFFAYLEDVDIGYRARLYGYKNMFCSNAKVYHIGSATSGNGYTPFKVYLSARNNIFLIYKNMPVIQMLANSPFLIFGQITRYLFFRRIGLGQDFLNGTRDGMLKYKTVNKPIFNIKHSSNYLKIQFWLIKKGIYFGMRRVIKIKH